MANDNYLKSNAVKVFPAGFREGSTDNSKVTTEENLTNLTMASSDYSIANRWFVDPNNANYDIIYIKGYRFAIPNQAINEGDAAGVNYLDPSWKYAAIKIRNIASKNINVLANYSSDSPALDVSDTFYGLSFYANKTDIPSEANIYWVEKNTKLILNSTEIKNNASASSKNITEEFNTAALTATGATITTANITTENATTANIGTGNITTANVTTINGLTIEEVASTEALKIAKSTTDILTVASGKSVDVNADVDIDAKVDINAQVDVDAYVDIDAVTSIGAAVDVAAGATVDIDKVVNIKAPLTVGVASTNEGAVNIKSGANNATTIVGPDNGTINLQANNATAVDKVWAQNNGTNSWVQYTNDATANTIVKRDANGDTAVRDLSVGRDALITRDVEIDRNASISGNATVTGTLNGAKVITEAASGSNNAKVKLAVQTGSTVAGVSIESPAQLKVNKSGDILVDLDGDATNADTTFIENSIHASLAKTGSGTEADPYVYTGINLGHNVNGSGSNTLDTNAGVTLPLGKTSSIGSASYANKIVVTDANGNINGAVTGEVGAATNVTTNIKGVAITSIFEAGETSGTITSVVKKASEASAASEASKTTNALTFSSTGNGDASASTFNGSAAKIISYNSIGAAPTSHASAETTYGVGTAANYGHVKLGASDQNGATAANGVAAPNGHTHSQYLTGNQTIELKGAVTGSGTTSITTTLADSGAAAGNYGNSTDQTPGYGDTFCVPYITVNAKGIVTGISNKTVKIPSSDNTDYQVQVNASSSKVYLSGTTTAPAAGDIAIQYGTASVYMQSGAITCSQLYLTSDKRLKENEKIWAPEKSILDLPIYKYDFIEGPKNQIGCMAQDLKEICPEIVNEDEEGYLHISESKIVYLLLDEVKKLKAEVEALKNNK